MVEVVVPAVVESYADGTLVRRGLLPAERVRRFEVPDARIDPDEPGLLLPSWVIEALGMESLPHTIHAGRVVLLTVQGRDCVFEAGEVPNNTHVVIGRIPLLAMDWVIDERGQHLIGNPEHGGEWMSDII